MSSSKKSKTKSRINPNIANPSVPDSFVSLSGAIIDHPHNEVIFHMPIWYIWIDYDEEKDNYIPNNSEIKYALGLSQRALEKAKEKLEISLAYPLNYVGLPYYNNFEAKKDRQMCGDCCYRRCQSKGHISSYQEIQRQVGVTEVRGFCYCDKGLAKLEGEYISHRKACSEDLLQLYTPYKHTHGNLDYFVLGNGPILQILYLKYIKKIVDDTNYLKILRTFRDQYFTDQLGVETELLLKELNGRIAHSRTCFDPSKAHCKIDWGHLSRILFLNNIAQRIKTVVDYIDQSALETIKSIEKRMKKKSDSNRSNGSKGSKGSKVSKGSKGSKGSKTKSKPLSISMSKLGSMKLVSKKK